MSFHTCLPTSSQHGAWWGSSGHMLSQQASRLSMHSSPSAYCKYQAPLTGLMAKSVVEQWLVMARSSEKNCSRCSG